MLPHSPNGAVDLVAGKLGPRRPRVIKRSCLRDLPILAPTIEDAKRDDLNNDLLHLVIPE